MLNGFTIRNGGAPDGNNGDPQGGGIYIYRSYPTISNNRIIQNTRCGGIFADGSPVIRGNIISNNVQQGCGGGYGGGGIFLRSSESARISDNVISENSVPYSSGGGIYLENAYQCHIAGNIIRGNVSSTGGGLYVSPWSDALIVQNQISGNRAVAGGGDVSGQWRSRR